MQYLSLRPFLFLPFSSIFFHSISMAPSRTKQKRSNSRRHRRHTIICNVIFASICICFSTSDKKTNTMHLSLCIIAWYLIRLSSNKPYRINHWLQLLQQGTQFLLCYEPTTQPKWISICVYYGKPFKIQVQTELEGKRDGNWKWYYSRYLYLFAYNRMAKMFFREITKHQ